MKHAPFRVKGLCIISLYLLFFIPAMIHAQSDQDGGYSPPLAQELVREGDFAIELQSALDLGTTQDEIAAESSLGEAGIAPRNGWIADYPVTPDIITELQKSVSDAAIAQKLPVGREEALQRFHDAAEGLNLAIRPYTANQTHPAIQKGPGQYPDQTMEDNYYSNQGPPVVTYYAPPPDYYYMYSWVPCPFWWADFWFGGFFILQDFHRIVHVHHRTVFISNHFNDIREHRVFRVDAVSRFHGKTFAGIGAPHRGNFISTGVSRSERTIFNGTRSRMMSKERKTTQPSSGGKKGSPTPHGGGQIRPPSGGGVRGTTEQRHRD
jgi:hypothetical protein